MNCKNAYWRDETYISTDGIKLFSYKSKNDNKINKLYEETD